MTKPIFHLILLLVFISPLATAQLSSDKFTEIFEEAQEYMLSEEYHEALIILKDLRENGFENANIDYKTGICYLNSTGEKLKALPLLKKASLQVSKDYIPESVSEQNAPVETWLFLGDAYRINNDFSNAINSYRKYALVSEIPTASEISMKRIRECNIARLLQSKPLNIKWELLGNTINQGIANFNPVISSDGTVLVFTRRMKFYDAILISHFKDGEWQEPENITTQVGSDGEFYPTALSSDGNRLLLNSYNVLSGQDIYESTRNGTRWTKLKKLDQGVNSSFTEINGSYGPDGKTIYLCIEPRKWLWRI
jgi:tetratricopeptide (TPR) repeat protein